MDNTEFTEIGLFELSKEEMENAGHILNVDRNGFFYCRQGLLTVAFNDKTYQMRRGDIFVYLPHSTIYIHEMSDDVAGVIGLARFEFVLSAIQAVSETYSYLYFKSNPCMSLSDGGQTRLEELFTAIATRSPQWDNPLVYQILLGLAKALCYQIMYEYFSGKPAQAIATDRQDTIFQKFMASLHKNYAKSRQVAFYAQENCLSPRYFSRIVKDKTGRTAQEWISAVVIDEARRLLGRPREQHQGCRLQARLPQPVLLRPLFPKILRPAPVSLPHRLARKGHFPVTFFTDECICRKAKKVNRRLNIGRKGLYLQSEK